MDCPLIHHSSLLIHHFFMNLLTIAWRSITQRSLASSLTALSMALGVALVVAVLVIHSVISRSFSKGAEGFDVIVGAKGSKLQLVLNTVYHLSTPVENVPWSYYQEFREGGRFAKSVSVAIPYCLGDSYEGFRVVGTIAELFEVGYADGEDYRFVQGRNFDDSAYFEAVIGAMVARRTGLKVGDEILPTHGVAGDGKKHDAFKVVGILAPTGTPNDRAVFVNMEGFYLLEGHAKLPAKPATFDKATTDKPAALTPKGDSSTVAAAPPKVAGQPDALPYDQREVTAILVRTKSQLVNLTLPRQINKEPYAQVVFPISEIKNLFDGIIGNLEAVLLVLAALVVVVSGIGIMVSIYNSMADRRRDIAIMRALGASRVMVLTIVLCESTLLALGGGGFGFLLGHALIAIANPIILAQTGVSIGFLQFDRHELTLIPALMLLAGAVGILPGLSAYRTDVSRALTAGG